MSWLAFVFRTKGGRMCRQRLDLQANDRVRRAVQKVIQRDARELPEAVILALPAGAQLLSVLLCEVSA